MLLKKEQGACPSPSTVAVNCKPPHAAEERAGRVSVAVNCKPPHADEERAGRVSVAVNCKPSTADRQASNVSTPTALKLTTVRRLMLLKE